MDIYELRSACPDQVADNDLDDNMGEILCGSCPFPTLEAAKAAAQQEWDEMKEEATVDKIEWFGNKPEASERTLWKGTCESLEFLITKHTLEVTK